MYGLMSSMIFNHRYQLTPDLNRYCFKTCNISNFNTSNPHKYRNSFSRYLCLCDAVFFYLGITSHHRLPSLQKILSLWPFFNMLRASEKFRSVRAMPIPAEFVLEIRQVNEIFELFGPWCTSVSSLAESEEQTASDSHGIVFEMFEKQLPY